MCAEDANYWLPTFISALANELNRHSYSGAAMCAWQCVGEDGTSHRAVRFLGKDSPMSKSLLKMALALATPNQYSQFFYGLFRRALLLSIMKFLPGKQSSDRLVLFELSLASQFRYIDMLHILTVYAEPYHKRYWVDEFVKNKAEYEKKLFHFKDIPLVARMIFQSPIIPPYKKILIVFILPYLAYKQTKRGVRRIRQSAKRSFRGLWGGA